MAAIERNMQEEEQFSGDDDSNSFVQNSEDIEEEDEEEVSELGRALELQGSAIRKEGKKKKGRKSFWSEDHVNELIDVICESEYYKRKLIFTNNKAVKNSELYCKIVSTVKSRLAGKGGFPFTVAQTRVKFKACIAVCKKAAMTRKTASGIDNFMHSKGYGTWFQKLFPLVESRDSCNPDNGIEPSFGLQNKNMGNTSNIERLNVSCENSETDSTSREESRLKAPLPIKKARKETLNSLLKEAVTNFNRFVAIDPTESLLAYFKEENERSRQHEREQAQMQLQMLQTLLMATTEQQQYMQGARVTQQATLMRQNFQNMNESAHSRSPESNQCTGSNSSQYSSWTSYIGGGYEQL